MIIIIGLGNPGKKYEYTRHNLGFLFVDALAAVHHANWQQDKKSNSLISEININSKKIILVKPKTFMNDSGQTAQAILNYYKLLPKTLGVIKKKDVDLSSKLIVIHDDVDIAFGKFKIQTNRSAAGHNGIKSIISHLKTQNFVRVRLGVNIDTRKEATEKFVLSNFTSEQKNQLPSIINQAQTTLEKYIN